MTTSPETEKAGVAELFKIYFPEVTLDERFCEAVQSYFQAHKEEALLSHGKEERRKAVEECAKVAEDMALGLDNEWNKKLGKADDLVDTCKDIAEIIREKLMEDEK